jgi:hypothetical protein
VRLDPFRERIHGDQLVSVAPGRLSQGSDDVQPPHGERPCDENCLQGVSRETSLACIELAPLASTYDPVGTSDRGGPVKALAECIAHEGTRRRVVATHARVDVSNEVATLRDGNAPLQDTRRGTLVQIAVDDGERFGHPDDAPGLGPIQGKFPSIHPSEVFGPPILRAGGWLCLHGLGLICTVALEQGEHECLVRGVCVHGLHARWI